MKTKRFIGDFTNRRSITQNGIIKKIIIYLNELKVIAKKS
jgi:hypothetical protein